MCFYEIDDCDYSPEVFKEEDRTATKTLKCHECGGSIPVGESYYWAFGQEHEVCFLCDGDDGDCEHDYGDSYEYMRCQTCSQLLDAIEDVEKSEGCSWPYTRPNFCELGDVFYQHQSAKKYATRVIELFPNLENNEWVRQHSKEVARGNT